MSNFKLFNQNLTNTKTQEYLTQVLGAKKNSFINNLTALVSNSASLQVCTPVSILYAGIKATALDLPLDPNLGCAYLIPFKDKKKNETVAQFQIGYKGFIQLAMRSGQFKSINVRDVREGEIVGECFVSGDIHFEMLKENREQAKVIGYVAYFKLINGFEKMLFMRNEELESHGKKYSQTYKKGSGHWKDDFESMGAKTALKRLLSKYAPLSIEMQNAINADQAVITDKGIDYIDNQLKNNEDSEKANKIMDDAFKSIEDAQVEEIK